MADDMSDDKDLVLFATGSSNGPEIDIYSKAEQELQHHTLAIYGKECNTSLFRLGDDVQVRFFSTDHATQTELTEIVHLKEMKKVIQTLMQDAATLQKDIVFTKHVMQAEHDSKLQAKSVELYCRINEKVADLEKTHLDRVNCLRKAYRQQLADAVAKLSVYFDKNLQHKMVREQTKQKSDLARKEQKFREMQATILRNEGVIQMLKVQLQQYQMSQLDAEEDRFMDRSFSLEESPPRLDSGLQEQLRTMQDELEEANLKVDSSERKILGLEETLSVKDEEIKSLHEEIDSLMEKLDKSDILVEKLRNEHIEMTEMIANEKESTKKLIGRKNEEMKRLLDEQVRLAKEEAMNKMKYEADTAASQDQNKIKQLTSQITELEKQLAKAKEKSIPLTQASVSSGTLPGSNEELKAEIKRLQVELEKSHRAWEKKFAILQQSMHALKDESYLRQTLQRQAAHLHKAAVSYSSDLPSGLVSYKVPPSSLKKPVRVSRGQGHEGEYNSYTISAPSDRGTALFFQDENQIMAENEADMLPADIEPLPSPAVRLRHDFGDERPPPVQSLLPVLPSIQAN